MPVIDEAKEASMDRAACPPLLTDPLKLARQSMRDAKQLAHDVREIDPAQVWGRLARWRTEDPERLFMALVTLAVYVPEDATKVLPEWVTALDGGLTALQPAPHIPQQARGTAA
jgi:hypothetical protein